MSNEFAVVVIGGGPVGLWLACELALAKVKVLVLERRIERVTQSRALTIHGRTLEVFALRGIAERFLSQGRPNPAFFWGDWTRCLTSRHWTRAFLSRCSCRRRRLKGSSRSVHWNWAWTSGGATLWKRLSRILTASSYGAGTARRHSALRLATPLGPMALAVS